MENKKLTTASGAPVADNHNVATAGRRGPMLYKMSGFWRNWLISIAK